MNIPFQPIISGNLKVKIAETSAEIEQAQRLRFEVFCNEMGAKANSQIIEQQRDFDKYDEVSDHLLVMNIDESGKEIVVGTYRLIRPEKLGNITQFYTESEFDITLLKNSNKNLLELGRSCVRSDFRNKQTMQMLWHGLGAYISFHNIELMFGCASFIGANSSLHKDDLAYLYANHLAPKEICPKALDNQYVSMEGDVSNISAKRAFMKLPVLIKAYLRVGGYIGDGAVIDHDFNTVDVSIIVLTEQLGEKYSNRYSVEKQ